MTQTKLKIVEIRVEKQKNSCEKIKELAL